MKFASLAFAAGLAVLAGACTTDRYGYGPYYGGYGGPYYAAAPYPYYGGGGGCYWQRQRVWDGWGYQIRRVRVCY